MSRVTRAQLLAAASLALVGDNPLDALLLSEVDCSACRYDDLPHEGGHCYMFQDPPEDNKCGAFEPKRKRT